MQELGANVFGDDDRWDDIIRINLTGTYNTLMACHPYLKRSEGVTHALVTSSVLARFGVPGQTAYVASKTGLLGLVRSLAMEWSPDGVMVNALCPGWVIRKWPETASSNGGCARHFVRSEQSPARGLAARRPSKHARRNGPMG